MLLMMLMTMMTTTLISNFCLLTLIGWFTDWLFFLVCVFYQLDFFIFCIQDVPGMWVWSLPPAIYLTLCNEGLLFTSVPYRNIQSASTVFLVPCANRKLGSSACVSIFYIFYIISSSLKWIKSDWNETEALSLTKSLSQMPALAEVIIPHSGKQKTIKDERESDNAWKSSAWFFCVWLFHL